LITTAAFVTTCSVADGMNENELSPRYADFFCRTAPGPLKHEKCPTIGKRKILIVDDNSDLRKLLALFLKSSDYDTVEAATGWKH
jgi:hypothetical protein